MREWANIFDQFASQYGWTIDQFLEHTPRQIQLLMKPMQNRKHNEAAFQVNIHGGKAEYEGGEIDDTLDWVKQQQKDNDGKAINDSMVKETEALGNG